MSLLKSIPKVDKFIMNEAFEGLSRTLITKIAKKILEELRNDILNNEIEKIDENTLINEVLDSYKDLTSPSLKSLINAT
ncbi:L-seryl-tRNA(Sec) selenium transferase, partial [Aliarcobacter butzleri]|nr:L-seryl-tRNA(Sec) selenium transferase [Aliarcobacter butzleri]